MHANPTPAATPMLYPELFKQLEAVRWNMDTDIPWSDFVSAQLTDEFAQFTQLSPERQVQHLESIR